jgi:hypothetical protein
MQGGLKTIKYLTTLYFSEDIGICYFKANHAKTNMVI